MANQYQNFSNPTIVPDQKYGWEAASQGVGNMTNTFGGYLAQQQEQQRKQQMAMALLAYEAKAKQDAQLAYEQARMQHAMQLLGANQQGQMGMLNAKAQNDMSMSNALANQKNSYATQNMQTQNNLNMARDKAEVGNKIAVQQSDPLYQMRMKAVNGMGDQAANFNPLNPVQPQAQSQGQPANTIGQDPNQWIMNPNFMFGGNDPFMENPAFKQKMDIEKQDKTRQAALEDRPPTAGQETTALYASRLQQANNIFDKISSFTNNLNAGDMFQSGLPEFANFLKSEDMQSYQQAQRNFLNAVLRKESGAVISPTEFKDGRQQYFPQPGDKPTVLEQKRQNRELQVQNFIRSSGKAYVPYEGTSTASSGQAIPEYDQNTQKLQQNQKTGEYRVVPK